MIKRIITIISLLGLLGMPAMAAERITVKGSTTVLPIAQIAAEVYMERNTEVNISIQGGGSGVGIAALLDGTTDIANASRKIKPKELTRAANKGIKIHETIVAMDGMAIVLHPSNKISALTTDQIRAIYTGKISNWQDLGGADKKIVVISRDSSSGTFEAFESLALNNEKVRPDALTSASNQGVAQTVAQTPGAIGYIGLGYLTSRVKPVLVDGVGCSKATIIDGSYPLARPLQMYTPGEPQGQVRDFLNFILSAEGQKLAEEEGFVGLR